MLRNDDVRFVSSSIKIPLPPKPPTFCFETLRSQIVQTGNSISRIIDSIRTRSKVDKLSPANPPLSSRRGNSTSFAEERVKSALLCSASLSLLTGSGKNDEKKRALKRVSPILCSASLSLVESTQEGKENPPKGTLSSRQSEERVLISEVLVRNKDGEELERKDLEIEALQALKACRPNSALTVREVQEDVHRIINSGYFCSCMPVAVDTRDGIRLVFQV